MYSARLGAVLLPLALWVNAAAGQTPGAAATGAPAGAPTVESVQAKIAEAEALTDLGEDLKNRVLELYHTAVSRLETARSNEAAADAFTQALADAPEQTAKVRAEIKQIEHPPEQPAATPERRELAELEQEQGRVQAELAAAKAQLAELDETLKDAQLRPPLAHNQITEAQSLLQKIEADLKTPPTSDEPPLLSDARRTAFVAARLARTSEIQMLEQELLSQPARVQLLEAQRDLAAARTAHLTAQYQHLSDQVAARRKAEAKQLEAQTAITALEAVAQHPVVRRFARKTAELSHDYAEVAANLTHANDKRALIETRLKDLEQEFKNVRQKIEIAGLSQALGQILREQRRKLPGVRGYRRDAKKRQEEIAQAGLALFRVEEQARGLLDADTVIHQILAEQLPADTPEEDYNHVADQLRALVRDREALLEKYRDALNDYVSTLGALDFAQRRLVVVATAYADFLDEHLLWIPSATPVGWQTLKDLGASLVWVTAVDNWRTLAAGVKREVTQSPLLTVAVLLVFAALMLGRRRLRADLTAIAERVAKPATDRFTHTLQALLVTGLLAAPWPVLFAFFGFRLENEVDAAEFTRAVGNGLLAIAVPFFMLRSFRVMCAKSGLVRAHFQWRERPVKLLRRYLAGLMTVMIPAAFVTGLAGWDSPEAYRDSLGRLAFVVWALSLAVFAWLALRTPGGLLDENLIANPRGWLARSRPLWYTLALGAPLAVCGLALSGYYYSALQLAGEMIPTLRLIAAAVIGHELVIRWLTLANRRLAQIRARERREAARAKEAVKEAVSASGDAAPATLEFAEVDIPAINTQTRQLLRTVITLSVVVGLWWIWSAVVPALGFLDHVTLWTYTTVMDGQETRAPITLLNLGMAVVLVMVFVAAARNLPGVLEILVLRRMELEPGSRYAVITVIKYAIAAIGGIVVFNAIGVQWSQLQWLIAALSVGLGFGLQEIVANFVSGLIILFERPIRVGDTVTVGGVSGTVTRIRIRATTITDWDRKELVVPNKTFITEQVVNWSLSDPITRVIVPVGIAYGSDTRRAHQVILDAVRAQPLVLDDPKPTVFFLGFGDSSLNFEVRAFVRELNKRLPLMHELHMAIDQALRDNGIEIPFPQRDLHIRSSAVPLGGSGGKPDAADAGEAPA